MMRHKLECWMCRYDPKGRILEVILVALVIGTIAVIGR